MVRLAAATPTRAYPSPGAVLELLKPITWFPPMWAFLCGLVSSGAPLAAHWPLALAGAIMAGPLLCAASQAVNDWFDRHVDAINEPNRPIPSGRIPGRWGLYIAIGWTALALAWSALLGPWVFGAAALGMALSWAYSAPPLRVKQSGWAGPAVTAISYEGIAWFAGAAVLIGAAPRAEIVLVAALYSVGAHGIMVLNDFKAIEGDRVTGVRSLPVQYGVAAAARIACATMQAPQLVIVVLLLAWGAPIHAALVAALTAAQVFFSVRLMRDPAANAPWFNGVGVMSFVLGMMITAHALGPMGAGAS